MRYMPAKSELRALMEQQTGPCLSLFQPSYRVGVDIRQNLPRLRNQIRQAEYRLLLNHLPAPQVEALVEPIRTLLEDEPFWSQPGEGLAIFRSAELFSTYWLPCRFKEQVIVARHFYLKPLLPFLTADGHFYLLALSRHTIRLLEGTHDSVSEVALPETVPHSLAEVIQYDHPDNQLRYHSSSSGTPIGKGGQRATMLQGQGVGADDERERLLRSFQLCGHDTRRRATESTPRPGGLPTPCWRSFRQPMTDALRACFSSLTRSNGGTFIQPPERSIPCAPTSQVQ